MSTRIARQLQSVDWDFPVEVEATLGPIHWYPGTFAAGLPAALIEALSSPGDVVFDPYGGIGTTAIEALRLGRRGWNVDLNPPALLASYASAGLVLLRRVRAEWVDVAFDAIEAWLHTFCANEAAAPRLELPPPTPPGGVDQLLRMLMSPAPEAVLRQFVSKDVPNTAALARWLEPLVLANVASVVRGFLEADLDAFCKVLALTMLSAVLRSVSSQTRSWGHIADNVYPKIFVFKDVLGLSIRWLRRTRSECQRVDASRILSNERDTCFRMHAIDWTSSTLPEPPGLADLMITSPPYAGAIDYALGQRLSLYLLGFDDVAVERLCQQEIGARRKRFSRNHVSLWADHLTAALERQVAHVQSDGFICLIMPHKDAGRELGTRQVERRLQELGWRRFFEIDRSIRQVRTRQSWTSIKKETLQIYHR